jgi:hypothetical protein
VQRIEFERLARLVGDTYVEWAATSHMRRDTARTANLNHFCQHRGKSTLDTVVVGLDYMSTVQSSMVIRTQEPS